MTDHEPGMSQPADIPILEGRLSRNTSWEFFESKNLPPLELTTAVCSVTTYGDKILLVQNRKGEWEFPAGRIEEGEDPEGAIKRELGEEAGGVPKDLSFFGYKKLTSRYPAIKSKDPETYYPHPNSYILFYRGQIREFNPALRTPGHEFGLFSYEEAVSQITNKDGLLEHLSESGQLFPKLTTDG